MPSWPANEPQFAQPSKFWALVISQVLIISKRLSVHFSFIYFISFDFFFILFINCIFFSLYPFFLFYYKYVICPNDTLKWFLKIHLDISSRDFCSINYMTERRNNLNKNSKTHEIFFSIFYNHEQTNYFFFFNN